MVIQCDEAQTAHTTDVFYIKVHTDYRRFQSEHLDSLPASVLYAYWALLFVLPDGNKLPKYGNPSVQKRCLLVHPHSFAGSVQYKICIWTPWLLLSISCGLWWLCFTIPCTFAGGIVTLASCLYWPDPMHSIVTRFCWKMQRVLSWAKGWWLDEI